MRKLTLLVTAVILSISMSAQDPHWNTDGNAGTSPINDFVGTTDNADLRFRTFDTFRMTLTSPDGWLGLNISTPEMMFHVDDGGILSTGTTGTNPDLNAGTRLMWIPDQGAFRAGVVDGTQWDDGDVGDHSVAFGEDNLVSGTYSVAFADGNEVTGIRSLAFGSTNVLSGANSIGLGTSHTINNTGGIGIGVRNTIDGDFGVGMGRFLHSNAENAIVLGRGVDGATLLENPIQNSMMVGFNSNLSTLFTGPSTGEDTFGSVGIGDITAPTERIDVNGTARLRVMPHDSADVFITGVQADTATGDYVLNYIPVDDLGLQCDWDVVNGGADVATGYTNACVQGSVLIGTDQPQNTKVYMTNADHISTLFVESNGSNTNQIGGMIFAEGGTSSSMALWCLATDSENNAGVIGSASGEESSSNQGVRGSAAEGSWNRGVVGTAQGGQNLNFGVYGESHGTGTPAARQHVGVYGSARDYSFYDNFGGYFTACDSENNIGVYAEVCDTTDGVAGYFVGSILTSQSPISLSDENIKTDMSELENTLEVINQINPVQYYFNTSEYPHLNLKNEKSYGFNAQEVQQVLPEVVQEVHHPAKFDTLGEMISPPADLLGIQYQEFIAILTAGIKEQQTQITEQEQTIDDLQQSLNNQNDLIADMMDQMDALTQQVNDCCDDGFKYNTPGQGHGNLNEGIKNSGNILDQNTPNPFRSQTNISYTLEQGGKVLLNIFDKTGKPITTLVEAEQHPGDYRYEWDASGLPAGLYHYALYVDGELLVKKAIKLAD